MTSAWTKSAQNRRRYASSSFISTSRNELSTSQRTDKHLDSLERYLITLTTKASTTTRHGSRLQILAHHQFYQQPPPRAHQQDQNWKNLPNTRISYYNTNTMYAKTRRIKRSTINTKQELRCYITWLQPTSRNPLYQQTPTTSLDFVLLILSSLWTTYKTTMELSPPINYKRMRLHWIHNGTHLLPLQYYSLALNIANYYMKLEKRPSLMKNPSLCIPCHKIHWIFQHDMWYLERQADKRQKLEYLKTPIYPKRHLKPNITPLSELDPSMNLPMLYYNWEMQYQNNRKKSQTYALYKNNQWTAPQNKRTSETK